MSNDEETKADDVLDQAGSLSPMAMSMPLPDESPEGEPAAELAQLLLARRQRSAS